MNKPTQSGADVATNAEVTAVGHRQEVLLKTGALQNAILHSANFSIIALLIPIVLIG